MFNFVVLKYQSGQTLARLVNDSCDFFIDFNPGSAAPFDYQWQASLQIEEGHDVGVNGRGHTWEHLPYVG